VNSFPQTNSFQNSTGPRLRWLICRRADFWLASSGASLGLLAAVLVASWRGDRELDALDLVLSELHIGATYDAVLRRRLWRERPIDALLIPFFIIVLTYVLHTAGQTVLLSSITMYAAIWHRGRQSLGVARFYQREMDGPVSQAHHVLFRGAIYLPMLAAGLAYSHLSPATYENEPYFALGLGPELTAMVGLAATLWVAAYYVWMQRESNRLNKISNSADVHPAECWVVLAHAVAFGSAYVLGALSASYLLVLAVHHEVQYLYFTYSIARRRAAGETSRTGVAAPENRPLWTEMKFAAAFLVWPAISFFAYLVGGRLAVEWLTPLGIGGLFCHYWLDGRIWSGNVGMPSAQMKAVKEKRACTG